ISSDGGKRKRPEDEEELVEAVFSDNDEEQGEKSDEIERKGKLQNKVRCQRYRNRRKSDITINLQISQNQTITVEEEIIIKRRKEQDKQKSKRYRDKKRAADLINLQTDQPSKPIAKHVPGRQNFHTSQIPGPSINYASNPQNILPCDAQNNIQNMCSQHNLSVQTYSSFQQNSSAHREFQKVFLKTDFGH
ncbi:hypothetical protein PV325_013653, partial [Microctonus aethiopoides]